MVTASGSDKRIGFSVLFGVLGLLGALVMLGAALDHNQLLAGGGFAVAMVAATLLVAVIHLYEQPTTQA